MKKITLLLIITLSLLLFVILITSCSSGTGKSSFSPPSNGVGRPDEPVQSDDTDNSVKLPQNGTIIYIDPGHGFRDPGAGAENYELGEGRDEKFVTLAVAEILGDKLEDLGYTVLFTHKGKSDSEIEKYLDDNYFDPNERVALVNSKKCDYFISLHCNIFDDPDVDGTKLYFFDNPIKSNHDSELIAGLIAEKIDTAFPDARKCTVETNSLAVIREVTVPSCLIEMGFVSNPGDAAKLVDPQWQKSFAEAVASGINAYFHPTEADKSVASESESLQESNN